MPAPQVSAPLKLLLLAERPQRAQELAAALAELTPNLLVATSMQDAVNLVTINEFAAILLDADRTATDCYNKALYLRHCEPTRTTPVGILFDSIPTEVKPPIGFQPGVMYWQYQPLGHGALPSGIRWFLEQAQAELVGRGDQTASPAEQPTPPAPASGSPAPALDPREATEVHLLTAQLHEQAKELAQARQRAELESQYKSKVLAGMSHELRTPLHSIIGFSELLEQQLFGPLSPRQQIYIGHVLQSGRHLLSLVNNVLDLSRIEEGRLQLRRGWVTVNSLIVTVVEQTAALATQRGVAVSTSVASDIPELYVDPARIRQALHHLLCNAIKFTAAGGSVSLHATVGSGSLLIDVIDTGIGIAKEHQSRLFREFTRIASPPQTDSQGAGLGLALTRRLVEMHGGQILVTSEPGVGSTFSISLPLLGHGEKRALGIRTPGYRDLTRVLVVEGDATGRKTMENLLNRVGLSVAVTTTAADAVRVARELRPGVMLLDILLPDADGWSVVSHLRSDPVTASIAVIVVSTLDEPERSSKLGVAGYLVKPVVPFSLLSSLTTAGMRVCSIEGLRVLVVGTEHHYIRQVIEHLHNAGCEVQRIGCAAERDRIIGPVDLVVVDATTGSPLGGEEPLAIAQLRIGTVPSIWLIDQEGGAPPVPESRGAMPLALADALHLPHFVRSIWATVANPVHSGPGVTQ